MDFVRRFKAKATKARQAGSRQKMAKKLEKELDDIVLAPKRKELSFSWPKPPQSDRTVLAVSDLAFQYADGAKLWEKLSFTLYRGQKIALVGHNGCGKSTLLRLLANRLEKTGGTAQMGRNVVFGYFSQHQLETLQTGGTVLGEMRRLSDPRATEEELMSALGLFLLGRNYFDRFVDSLSGGEKSRLLLASLFLARCNFLLLDEPTNHLDLESREALTEALSLFSGTILFVAHDRRLLAEVGKEIWRLEGGRITVYDRGYAQYDAARRETPPASGGARPGGASAASAEKTPAETLLAPRLSREEQKRLKREMGEKRNKLYKELSPLQERYAGLEKELEDLLAQSAETEKLLADPAVYADNARTTVLLRQFPALQTASEKVMEEMTALEERIAALTGAGAEKA
ncbi:hypothetical protein FACS1894206_09250 [Deltaproteobacteria bacterium]|nr:hypothetical protein FACS1894206_09250 [Deltaproteobacteria bacterium]